MLNIKTREDFTARQICLALQNLQFISYLPLVKLLTISSNEYLQRLNEFHTS